jgi:hypothetical protein
MMPPCIVLEGSDEFLCSSNRETAMKKIAAAPMVLLATSLGAYS